MIIGFFTTAKLIFLFNNVILSIKNNLRTSNIENLEQSFTKNINHGGEIVNTLYFYSIHDHVITKLLSSWFKIKIP